MKKAMAMVLALTLLLAACGQSGAPAPASASRSTDAPPASSVPAAPDSGTGRVEVEQDLFDVKLTLPADLVGEDVTQDTLDALAQEKGYQSITLNEDGSATYVITHAQHQEMLQDMRNSLNESLSELAGSEQYPEIVSIEANDAFTEYTVRVSGKEEGYQGGLANFALLMYSGMYHVFTGEAEDISVHIRYEDADTGALLSEYDSAEN